jgi:Putative Actinobacterial Holin-X, holin superfamily III
VSLHPEAGAHAAGAPLTGGVHTGAPGNGERSLGELFADVSNDLSTLVRQEVTLAKVEIQASAQKAGKGAGLLAGAGVAGHFVLLFLSVAAWWGLGHLIDNGWSALVVAAVWAIIAAVLASMGRKEVKQVRGLPKTTATAKQIPDALKGNEGTTR